MKILPDRDPIAAAAAQIEFCSTATHARVNRSLTDRIGAGVMRALLLAGVVMVGWTEVAHSAVTDLTFEGLQNNEAVGSYYNGSLGGNGSGPGTNYGITFSTNALALISDQAGGTGNFDANAPSSGKTVLYFYNGNSAYMNLASGFQTGFSFYYSAILQPGSVSAYSGLNGTGTLLGTLSLPLTPTNSAFRFQPMEAAGLTFSGTAESILFSGVGNQITFDDVTFGSATPGTAVPEPASLALLGIGAAGIVAVRRRRA